MRFAFHRALVASLGVALLAPLAGCGSNFKEVHYFKSLDDKKQPVNFYRVTVRGTTSLSSSRYLSGYFDERAVEVYFSEFTQPDKAHFEEKVKDDSGKLVPIGAGQENRRLVMILSSNSDEIATSISALAQSEAVTDTLANLIGRDRLESATDAKLKAPAQAKQGEYLANSGKTLVEGLAADADLTTTTANFRLYANELAHFLEPGRQFNTLAEAHAWAEKFEDREGRR